MMAPLPAPHPPPDRPELPRVRLDVRTGSGRSVSYEVGSDEFLIGGAAGCDLRLPASNLPPVICQLTRKPDGVRARRLAPGLPVLLNGSPLPSNTPTAVNHGDRLTVAGVEITAAIIHGAFVSAKLVPVEEEVPQPGFREGEAPAEPRTTSTARQEPRPPRSDTTDLHRREADLDRRQRELDRQAEDLEADRVLWYQRRQEIARELDEGNRAKPDARTAELAAKEQELNRVRDELSALRQQLVQQYQERRGQLDEMQEAVRRANGELQAAREAFDADQVRRRAELEAETEKLRQHLDAEAAERRELLAEEFRQKREAFNAELAEQASRTEAEALERHRAKADELDRAREELREATTALAARREQLEAEAAEKQRSADAEMARRRAAFEAELAGAEPRLADLRDREARLDATAAELNRQREFFVADRAILDKARETFEAERTAELDRLNAWEKGFAGREAELARREEQLRTDREVLDGDRSRFQDDMLLLERRAAVVDDRERELDARSNEVTLRLDQLMRDAAEWDETVQVAATEQERLRAEAERLDRQKAELDAQTARLAERAGQLESQQAVLAVLRSKLDRSRAEAEREATQLAMARVREDEAQAELRSRIREAEQLRAELNIVQENTAVERQRLEERDSLLAAGLEEIRQQKESLAAEDARLRQQETELDTRTAEFAEQAGSLKGRMAQALDLQSRLEADRVAVREREAALARSEEARVALQEQLRRRAEELTTRARTLDEVARQVAADRTSLDQARAAIDSVRATAEQQAAEIRTGVELRAAEVEQQITAFREREEALGRQVARLKDVGAAVAAERKNLADVRAKWEADRAAGLDADRKRRDELEAFRRQAAADIDALRAEAPELEAKATAALDRLSAARDMLRGHLSELNDFARQNRDDLETVRAQMRLEADRLREQEAALNRSRAEHRLAVTAFRQQLIDWQGQVTEIKQGLTRSESRLEAKQAAVDEAARQVDATSQQLAEQAERLRLEREAVTAKRAEMDRHLADMREWYRKKLRELAGARSAERGTRNDGTDEEPAFDKPRLAAIEETDPAGPESSRSALRAPSSALDEELDPGDRQLGELLRSLELVDADTLTALLAEATRQRRTLRQVLLASGTVTLYQLALIEAGNLDGLMLGRLRVIERMRSSAREAIYRVFDPTRGGVFLLRHLAEAEAHDALHPDEFRQRFAAARDAAHQHLAGVVEVLDLNGRPAVLLEWPAGLFSGDWPASAAHPGCWVRLLTMAAQGLTAAHRAGLTHGRLTADSFLLTSDGVLKVTGFGEPPWLAGNPAPVESTPAADLRALGQVAFGWSQPAGGSGRGTRAKTARSAKPFPPELQAIIRRLEADPEPPMADTVVSERGYESAADLLTDLKRVARETAFSDDAWNKLLRHVAETAPDGTPGLRRSA